ncbi:MAG: MFS transporter [Thiohalospira sp.]
MADRLSWGRLLAYGLPGLPLAVLGLPLYVYLPGFYAEEVGLGLTLTGALLLIARIWDMVTDPVVGSLGDRLHPPLGRRRGLMLLGAPLLLIAATALFLPPEEAGGGHLLLWSLLIYLGWTLVTLPYTAWGAELSDDYDERSRITGVREGAVVLGTLVAALLPPLLGRDEPGPALAVLTAFLWLAVPVTIGLALWRVPEPTTTGNPIPWREGLTLLRGNRPFFRLLLAYAANGTANALPATLFLLFVEHIIQRPEWTGTLLGLYFVAGIAGLPLWLALARRWGKHRTWAASMLWAAAVFTTVPLLGAGDLVAFGVIVVLSGLSLGVDMALPASIQADVVDEDTAAGGGGRAGLFFGLWGMATKLALALAVGIAFPLLDLAGFDGPAGEGLLALALLYGGLPVLIKIAAVALVWDFPVDRVRQHQLQGSIHHETDPSPPGPRGPDPADLDPAGRDPRPDPPAGRL